MRITLAVLLMVVAWLTIYCNSAVLSLPPSLIASAASLRQQQHQQFQPSRAKEQDAAAPAADTSAATKTLVWKKDPQFLIDDATNDGTMERAVEAFDGIRRIQSHHAGHHQNNNHNSHHHHSTNDLYGLHNKATSATAAAAVAAAAKLAHHPHGADLNRKLPAASEYDLNALLSAATAEEAAADAAIQQSAELLLPSMPWLSQEIAPRNRAFELSEFFTPLKYWARHCQADNNCPQEYYRALLAGRNIAAALRQINEFSTSDSDRNVDNDDTDDDDDISLEVESPPNDDDDSGSYSTSLNDDPSYDNDYHVNNDIFMLLTGEQDIIKFLHWAMQQLYPFQRFANYSENSADYYHPGMYIWKKLNLSGRLEPPLIVEEPRYVIVRREQLEDNFGAGSNYRNDPFIPQRGRKHNLPDLDALLHRYETFVPNRGKRDKIKDIFKYDDLFFPNRGKKQKPIQQQQQKQTTTTATTAKTLTSQGKLDNDCDQQLLETDEDAVITNAATAGDDENSQDDSLTAPPSISQLSRRRRQCMLAKLKLRIQQHAAGIIHSNEITSNDYDNSNNNELPQKMSTYKQNAYDQSVRPSMPQITTREMSSPMARKNALQQHQHYTQQQQHDQQQEQQQQQKSSSFIYARPARIGSTLAGAARVAANRLHSTRSMSARSLHRRQPQLSSSASSFSSAPSTYSSRYRQQRREQQQPLQQQQHQVKSLNNLDPLLWRQLQLLQQKSLTMRHPQRVALMSPQETQLAGAAPAAAMTDSDDDDADDNAADDIDYSYLNI